MRKREDPNSLHHEEYRVVDAAVRGDPPVAHNPVEASPITLQVSRGVPGRVDAPMVYGVAEMGRAVGLMEFGKTLETARGYLPAVELEQLGQEIGVTGAQGGPTADLVRAIVHAYVAAVLRSAKAQIADVRRTAIAEIRQMLEDAVLDAVREVEPADVQASPRRTRR